jgi:hypothetical protein
MKPKIGIKQGLLGLLISILTACTSFQEGLQPSSSQEPPRFVDAELAPFMRAQDYVTLEKAITTAAPKQQIKWSGSKIGVKFQFISRRIFVNAAGQGCRDYQLKVQHGLGRQNQFERTVCRDQQGVWQPQLSNSLYAERQGDEMKSSDKNAGFS